ncbi:hypothetical protein [Enterovibrio baiacu]|uniref:hypothetical protein n=1 Tax=Enterovibrio baiacu TaxID=2491023 RepID=UPI0013867083
MSSLEELARIVAPYNRDSPDLEYVAKTRVENEEGVESSMWHWLGGFRHAARY